MASKVSGVVEKIKTGGSSGTSHAIASTAYGYCETEAATPAKVVDMTGFELNEGVTIHVKFANANTAASPTLNVNGKGAKPIVQYGTTAVGDNSETSGWQAGAVLSLTYDGASWIRDQGYNTNDSVTQTGITTSADYPLIFKHSANTTDETAGLNYSNNTTDNVKTTKPFTFNPSTGQMKIPSIKIAIQDDNYGIFPYASNWNQIGSSSLSWYRAYINNYYGTTSHVTNWDANKNIGTSSSSSAAATKGSVNFYNVAAKGATQTKTLLQANDNTTANITLNLPSTSGTLALTTDNITGTASALTNFVVSTYTLAANKGVRITYPSHAPVLISCSRSNNNGRLILIGSGYGADGWTRNNFQELVSPSSSIFTWCLSDTANSVEIFHAPSDGVANIIVQSTSSATFTEINALTKTAENRTILTTNKTVTAAQGGTGQSSYTIGDILYASAATTLSKLGGNTTTTRKFLRSVATTAGTAVAPAWDTLTADDIPSITKSKISDFSHTHGNITNDGKMSGSTASGAVTTSHKFLREDGTWVVPKYTTNSDEKVKVAALTSGTTYYPILATAADTATRQADTTLKGLSYISTAGTTSAVGTAILALGNTTAKGTANNEQGVLRLYGTTAKYVDMKMEDGLPADNRTMYLPSYAGTMYMVAATTTDAVGGDKQPIYINNVGAIQAGTALKDLAYIAKPSSNTTTTFLRGDGTWQTALTSHRTYTAVTGNPTENQTPSFGSTFTISQISQSTTGQITATDKTVTIPNTSASATVIGLVDTSAQEFMGVKTFRSGIEIKGHIAGDASNTGHGLYSGGGYHNAYNNIILHGDASTGSSGIAFISDKINASTGAVTTINQPSDRAFIQYHACGVTTATSENTAPTLATSGEKGIFVIGIGNDGTGASEDRLWLQVPGHTGLLHRSGTDLWVIPDTGNTSGDVGGTTTPVYVKAGVITALGYTIAKSVPSDAKFTDTTYANGTGITIGSGNAINHSNSVTAQTTQGFYPIKIDAQGHISSYGTGITPITSVNGHTGSSVSVTAGDLGLSSALRFVGKTTSDISESFTNIPAGIDTNYTPIIGDVVLDKNNDAEYVCIAIDTSASSTVYTWELLGRSGSWATSDHKHTLSLASDNGTTNVVNLSASTTYKLTAGGNSILIKTPADTKNSAYGNINTSGQIGQTANWSLANGDGLVVFDSSNSNKLERSGITFDGSTTNKALTPKGTWESFLQSHNNLVKQTLKSDDASYNILATNSSATGNAEAVFDTGITLNPNTHTITATTFVGALTGKATNAGYIEATDDAATWAGALLRSGSSRANNATGDTWIFADQKGSSSSNYGIKHDQVNDAILFVGANTTRVTISLSSSKITATTFDGKATTAGTADSANNVAWANTNHPSTFPPTIGTTATTAMAGNTVVNKVKTTAKSDDVAYKILMSAGGASLTSGSNYEAVYDANITINPSTSTITATNFAGNADTATADIEGRNFTDAYAKEYVQVIDLTGDDITKWYPVTIPILARGLRRISCVTQLNSGYKPSWSSHSGGYTAVVEMLVTASGWGTTSGLSICLTDNQMHLNANEPKPVGFSQFGNSSRATFWCRGGAKYKLLTDFFGTWTVYKTDTTVQSQTIGPKTTNPGINFSKSTITANLTGDVTGNASSATTLANLYDQDHRPGNANLTHINNGGVQHFKATSGMGSNKPMADGNILHFHWDYSSSAWDSQLFVPVHNTDSMQWRGSSAAGTWGDWTTVLDSANYSSYALPLSGGQMTGPLTWANATALPQKTSANYFLAIDAFADGGKTYFVSKANVLSSIGAAASSHNHGNIGNGGVLDNKNRLVWTDGDKKIYAGYHYASATQVAINSTTTPATGVALSVNGNTSITGDLIFPTANKLDWNSDTYRQRITITDDGTAGTAVFTFQQSADGGTNYLDLFTIKDTGSAWAGSYAKNTAQTDEHDLGVYGGAGKIFLYAAGATNGNKGLYAWNAAETTKSIILAINQSNQITTLAEITGTLTLSKTQDASGTANNSPALIVGGAATSTHLELDCNEVMAKATGTTTAALYLNADGNAVILGKASNGTTDYVQIRATTAASSTATGALRVGGGAGFGGTVYAAGFNGPLTGNVSGTATAAQTLTPTKEGAFTSDPYGNFKHKRTTVTDNWQLKNSQDVVKIQMYWETGNITTVGDMSAKSYVINDGAATPVEKARMQWNAADQSIDFVFA